MASNFAQPTDADRRAVERFIRDLVREQAEGIRHEAAIRRRALFTRILELSQAHDYAAMRKAIRDGTIPDDMVRELIALRNHLEYIEPAAGLVREAYRRLQASR